MSWERPWKKSSRENVERPYTQSPQRQQPVLPIASEQGRATYWSDNKEEQSTFYAEAPANSQHAARLMKLAMQNQPEYAKAEKIYQKHLEEEGHQRLTVHGEPAHQLGDMNGPSRSLSKLNCEEVNSQGHPPLSGHLYTSDSITQQDRQIPSQLSSHAQIPSTEVYRYERDGQITYHKKTTGGELMVSAPQSSQEAQSMENAAAKLRTFQQYPTIQVISLRS